MTTSALAVASGVVVALAMVAGVLAFIDAGKSPSHRRPYRVFEAVACYYFVVIYTLAAFGYQGYALRSGMLTRGGLTLLFIYLITELVAYRRHAN